MPHDKAFWQAITGNEFRLPIGYSASDLLPDLLDNLRDPDPELRDQLSYEILSAWLGADYYETDALRAMGNRWCDDLHHGLGERDTDSVLRRSFAALMLSHLVLHDIEATVLEPAFVRDLVPGATHYLNAERDLRGYDERVGWVHAPAHTAKLLQALARHPQTTADHHQQILDAVTAFITEPRPVVFTHSEPTRLALVVPELLVRNRLPAEAYTHAIEQWTQTATTRKAEVEREDAHGMYHNTKAFLHALYFLLAHDDAPPDNARDLQTQIFDALRVFRQ